MDLQLNDPVLCTDFLEESHPGVSYIAYDWGLHIDTRPNRYTKFRTSWDLVQ